MKTILIGFAGLVLLSACSGKKSKIDPFESFTVMVDSAGRHSVDTLSETKEEELSPAKADEIFDDFIYSFAADRKLQKERVLFPLPYYNMDKALKIEEKYWKHDSLFLGQAYYTLLFDKEEDMEMVQDTSLVSVQFEWIDMASRTVKKYYFERLKGAWMLEAVNKHRIGKEENEDFVDFFYRFANDSVFRSSRISSPVTFVTNDPDDDFSILETTVGREQWLAFMTVLPEKRLTNINYGQKNRSGSRTKILNVRGINNGFFNSLYFRRSADGEWELYKFEDLSN